MGKKDVVVYSEDYKKLVDATALKDKYYEIDERVEEICKEAFKGCDRLKEIVMPKKLKKSVHICQMKSSGQAGVRQMVMPIRCLRHLLII